MIFGQSTCIVLLPVLTVLGSVVAFLKALDTVDRLSLEVLKTDEPV
jgi:hypothetical protein